MNNKFWYFPIGIIVQLQAFAFAQNTLDKNDCSIISKCLADPKSIGTESNLDKRQLEKLLESFQKSIDGKDENEEIFLPMLQIGFLKEALNKNSKEVVNSYKHAYACCPTRFEPLYYLSHYLNKLHNHEAGFKSASQGLALLAADDIFSPEKWVSAYELLLEYSISSYWTGHYLESLLASNLILSNKALPGNVRQTIEKNLTSINKKIAEIAPKESKSQIGTIAELDHDESTINHYIFSLALSYQKAKNLQKALAQFQRRAQMKGDEKEVYWSLLQTGIIKEALNEDPMEIIEIYKAAYNHSPSRGEALYLLSNLQRKLEDYEDAFDTASLALMLQKPNDMKLAEEMVYDYGNLLEYSLAAYKTQRYLEAYLATNLLILNKSIPQSLKETAEKNLIHTRAKLADAAESDASTFTYIPKRRRSLLDTMSGEIGLATRLAQDNNQISLPIKESKIAYSEKRLKNSLISELQNESSRNNTRQREAKINENPSDHFSEKKEKIYVKPQFDNYQHNGEYPANHYEPAQDSEHDFIRNYNENDDNTVDISQTLQAPNRQSPIYNDSPPNDEETSPIYKSSSYMLGDTPTTYGEAPLIYRDGSPIYRIAPCEFGDTDTIYGDNPPIYSRAPYLFGDTSPLDENQPLIYRDAPPMYGDAPPIYRGSPSMYGDAPPMYRGAPPMYGDTPPIYRGSPPMYLDAPHIYRDGPHENRGGPPIYGNMPPMYRDGPAENRSGPPMYEDVPPNYGDAPPIYGNFPQTYSNALPAYGEVYPDYGQDFGIYTRPPRYLKALNFLRRYLYQGQCNTCCGSPSPFAASLYGIGYLGKGFGNVNSYGTVGAYIDWNATYCLQPFIDVRGHNFGKNRWGANIGVGLRYIDKRCEAVYGINAFYDWRRTSCFNFQQAGIGLEYSGRIFDLFANYYLPVGKKDYHKEVATFNYPGDYVATLKKRYSAFRGGDIEIGTSWNRWFCPLIADFYVGVGGYRYNRRHCTQRSFTGVKYRAEINYHDILVIGLRGTYDNQFHSTLQGYIGISLNFDEKGIAICHQVQRTCFCNDILGRPVQRNPVILKSDPDCRWETNFPPDCCAGTGPCETTPTRE